LPCRIKPGRNRQSARLPVVILEGDLVLSDELEQGVFPGLTVDYFEGVVVLGRHVVGGGRDFELPETQLAVYKPTSHLFAPTFSTFSHRGVIKLA
jgi:hypothetical protein